ncbi:hypothetical protein JB92DRAFT_1814561 [Gautieria morchelliformis]|nr:hypothetical protein JB92DRAFT_1814561 [Gautieria morchelliformis]
MTDPTEPSVLIIPSSLDAFGLVQDVGTPEIPKTLDNPSPMKFAEMRGSPSLTPSLPPASPGTGYLVRMKQNTPCPVSPRRTPRASPSRQEINPEPSSPTPIARDATSGPSISVLVESDAENDAKSDHANYRHPNIAGAEAPPSSQEIVEAQLMIMDDAGDPHEVDIDTLLFPGLDSQWQPQSQLPLPDSFEYGSLPSTINPTQLHAEEN